MNDTELQHAGMRQYLFHILIGDTTGNDTDLRIVIGHLVQVDAAGILRHLLLSLLYMDMSLLRHARHHDILNGISYILLIFRYHTVFQIHHALGMRQTGGGPQDHRRIVFLGNFKGPLGKYSRLLAVGGLDHGNMCRTADHPGVLLIL